MDISELKLILTLAEQKNFTDAAYACSISQSSLSKHLANVEHELGGIELFDRSTRPISVTPEGKAFTEHARILLQEYETMLQDIQAAHGNCEETLRIGAIPVMARFGLSPIIKNFRQQLPSSARLELTDRPTGDLLDMMKNGELDAAIIVLPHRKRLDSSIRIHLLASNPICLITSSHIPADSPLLKDSPDLSGETMAILDEHTGMHYSCLQACHALNLSDSQIHYYRSVETILGMIREQECVGLMTDFMVKNYSDSGLKIIHFKPEILSDIVLAVPDHAASPLLHRFICHMEAATR